MRKIRSSELEFVKLQSREKAFVGPRVRRLREGRMWTLETCAADLGVSVSYLSQIESNQRPVTARVLLALMRTFELPAAYFDINEDRRLTADLRDALAQAPQTTATPAAVPAAELHRAALQTPTLARCYLDLLRAYQRLDERLRLTEEAVSLDEASAASSLLPYEEVRDFFHHKDNYVERLDRMAEALAARIGLPSADAAELRLVEHLGTQWGVSVGVHDESDLLRRFDPLRRELSLARGETAATGRFQLAYQIAAMAFAEAIELELESARLRTSAARAVCRIGLTNYAAGALLMPYGAFRAEAAAVRHDLERLVVTFQASLEQVAHRLSTLQRPGERGLPFFFVRLDAAGNITKRHSATRLRFARFGGACPLWNVHDALGAPDRFLVQLAEMPDGARYLSVARSVTKPSRSYAAPDRRYIIGFGCELDRAEAVVYGDGLQTRGPATPIGVSCRICERERCAQRAFPPLDRGLRVPPNERRVTPFDLV